MSIAKVEKVQLLGHAGVKMELLSSLQEAGLVQLEEAKTEEFDLRLKVPDAARWEHVLHRIKHTLDYLSHYEGKGLVRKLVASKPRLSPEERKKVLSWDYMPDVDKVEMVESDRNELLSEVRFLEKEIEFLSPLQDLDLPLSLLKATETAEVLIGHMPLAGLDDFQKMTEENAFWHTVISQEKRSCYVLVIYRKEENDIEEKLKNLQFTPLYLTESIWKKATGHAGVKDIIEKDREEIGQRKAQLAELDEESRRLSGDLDRLKHAYDVLMNEREKFLSARHLGETERVFYMEGWVCSADKEKLKAKLNLYADAVELYFRPPLASEEIPVVLENPRSARPFEVLTKLYGYPLPGSLDPTIFLAPFFFLFVGLTVSEAGYGLLVAILSLLFLKFAKPKGGMLQFARLMALLGAANVVVGTLIGGWFGFPIRKLMLLDPVRDPLPFLILSLILGFIQVWFGTLLSMINGFKNRMFLQPVFVQGGWLLLLPSLVAYALTKNGLFGILALVGAGGIVFFAAPSRNLLARFFGGLYSLYDISRYLADVLSYSRLMALGMATSVIAIIVNTMCQTALGIPWVGWLIAAVIFLVGHLFNLGISFLGGFVHSMRLQFVEFFSKFIKAGGKPFKPFALEGKFVEFTE